MTKEKMKKFLRVLKTRNIRDQLLILFLLANPRLKINALLNLRICDVNEEMLQDQLVLEAWQVLIQAKEESEHQDLVFQGGHKKGRPLERSVIKYVRNCILEEANIEEKANWPTYRKYYQIVKNEV